VTGQRAEAEDRRAQALAARERAVLLRARSRELRDRSDAATLQLLGGLRGTPCGPLGGRGDAFELRFARFRPAVALARYELRRWLNLHGVDPRDARDVALACSEACANAVEHPRAPVRQAFELTATLADGELELVVRDFGSWRLVTTDRVARGRGLDMIRSLMDDSRVVAGADGTRVTMRRSLATVSPSAPR
jgi:anti-sigma regulatory factor (Ser/Thr protein kinase)